MSLTPRTEWLCSLERLHQNEGYVLKNIALCCYEMNGAMQWSHEKLHTAIEKGNENFPSYNSQLGLETNKIVRASKTKSDPNLEAISKRRCRQCQEIKDVERFTNTAGHESFTCNVCHSKYQKERRKTPLAKLRELHDAAIGSSRRRNHPFNLQFDDIIQQYHAQEGRCKYSNIPMTFSGDWKVSLERLDPKLPYTKTNIALICHEFNTVAQFSKEKWELIKSKLMENQSNGNVL